MKGTTVPYLVSARIHSLLSKCQHNHHQQLLHLCTSTSCKTKSAVVTKGVVWDAKVYDGGAGFAVAAPQLRKPRRRHDNAPHTHMEDAMSKVIKGNLKIDQAATAVCILHGIVRHEIF